MSHLYQNLVDQLVEQNFLHTPEIIAAFRHVKRNDFVLPGMEREAHYNYPLMIGYGQTISQPATVAFMLELLQPKVGDKILDVGAGSGWQTALLAKIVGRQGQVVAIERIPQLVDFAKQNLAKYNFDNVELVLGDGSQGYSKYEPYDGIIVAAAAKEIPAEMLRQLKLGGRLVIPVGEDIQAITLVKREGERDYKYQEFPGFRFVPLISDKQDQNN